jgi:hypothetical protein
MSDSISVSDGAHAKRAGNRTIGAALALVAAVTLFAAAFWFVGGVDYVAGLIGGGPETPATTPGATPAPGSKSATATATPTPSTDVPDALSRRMYIEQIESAPQIDRLAAGQTTGFTIDGVTVKSPTETWVAVTAKFTTAPTTMKGVMAFAKAGANWYFLWIQDLNGAASSAQGRFTTPKLTEPSEPTDEEFDEAGITTVDQGVIDSVLGAQAANQGLVAGILDGTYSTITLAKPLKGAGTITVPVTATGKAGEVKGSITLITKRIDGKERTFIASFKKQ